jgi:hypothetical protein
VDFAIFSMFWGDCGSQLISLLFASCIMGSLNVCSGESSTRTLFFRVMDTFDDDDDLPVSTRGHDAIFSIIDHFSRLCRFIPCSSNMSAFDCA